MDRRSFLRSMAIGCGGAYMARGLTYAGTPGFEGLVPKTSIVPHNTARNFVFVLLQGGASHVDTFDLKTNASTPAVLGATVIGGTAWPEGIMPQLATRLNQFALVRSIVGVEAVHERAVYHLATSHRHDASRTDEIAHMASAMSFMLADQRRPSDSLPTVVMFGPTAAAEGFFPVEHKGLSLSRDGQIPNLVHPHPGGDRRLATLNALRNLHPNPADIRGDRLRIQDQAQALMNDSELQAILGNRESQPGQQDNYTRSGQFKQQCEAIVRLLGSDRGTRIVTLNHDGWDHHNDIYNPQQGIPALATDLDDGLAYLLDALAGEPGTLGGNLLDETLVMVAGEFGRTTGPLNQTAGRDHYPYAMSALFAGGGVKGGRVIGATDQNGATVTDVGWSHPRYMSVQDLCATAYSAMGIDWTVRFTDTPSGRIYDLVPAVGDAIPQAFDPLFA